MQRGLVAFSRITSRMICQWRASLVLAVVLCCGVSAETPLYASQQASGSRLARWHDGSAGAAFAPPWALAQQLGCRTCGVDRLVSSMVARRTAAAPFGICMDAGEKRENTKRRMLRIGERRAFTTSAIIYPHPISLSFSLFLFPLSSSSLKLGLCDPCSRASEGDGGRRSKPKDQGQGEPCQAQHSDTQQDRGGPNQGVFLEAGGQAPSSLAVISPQPSAPHLVRSTLHFHQACPLPFGHTPNQPTSQPTNELPVQNACPSSPAQHFRLLGPHQPGRRSRRRSPKCAMWLRARPVPERAQSAQ